METWDLVSRFPSRYRHLEFLIHLLIGPIFKTPSWIWKTIESIVLETIAYCLSRLLIGYCPYEPGIVVRRIPRGAADEGGGAEAEGGGVFGGLLVRRFFLSSRL